MKMIKKATAYTGDDWLLFSIPTWATQSYSDDGGEYYELRFFNAETKEDFISYIDPANKNFDAYWNEIIENKSYGVFIFKNFRLKKAGLINADSKPMMVDQCSKTEAEDIRDELL